ncbi:pilin [Candidatus Parcubacteria bacterium]|nr:pilin [Candidatus Parcubacteria bacterium]
MTFPGLLNKIFDLVLNPLISLLFGVALLVFFWGIVQFINSETSDSKRDEGKKKIIYGLLGLFVMFSAYGIIRLILNTFGIELQTNYLGF